MPHAGGRPTEYDPLFAEAVDSYILTTGKENMTLPKREGLAKFLHVNVDTVQEWCKIYPEFSVAVKKIDELQKERLMDDGLYGGKEVNSPMAIFLLKANHGMIETEKRILAGDQENPIKVDIGVTLSKVYGENDST